MDRLKAAFVLKTAQSVVQIMKIKRSNNRNQSQSAPTSTSYLLKYQSEQDFKNIANPFGLMTDSKAPAKIFILTFYYSSIIESQKLSSK